MRNDLVELTLKAININYTPQLWFAITRYFPRIHTISLGDHFIELDESKIHALLDCCVCLKSLTFHVNLLLGKKAFRWMLRLRPIPEHITVCVVKYRGDDLISSSNVTLSLDAYLKNMSSCN
jgi:hypothetical protein